jgi:hypothetical protein
LLFLQHLHVRHRLGLQDDIHLQVAVPVLLQLAQEQVLVSVLVQVLLLA